MSTNVSRTHYSGLIIPDDQLEVWDAECVGLDNTAGGHVGQPVETTGRTSSLALRTIRRERTGVHAQVTVATQTPGIANEAAAEPPQAGTFVWSQSGVTYGWNPPNVLTGMRTIRWTNGSGVSKYAKQPHLAVTNEGTAIIAYEVEIGSGPSSGTRTIQLNRKVAEASDWADPVVVITGLDGSTASCPCLMPLPDGRLLMYYANAWTDGPQSGVCIASVYSDDDGVTWSATPKNLSGNLGGGADTVTQIRAACAPNGEVLLIVCRVRSTNAVVKSIATQYVSVDYGATLEAVGTTTDTAGQGVAFVDVVWHRTAFIMAYLCDSDGYPRVARFGSASTPIHSADTTVTDVDEIGGFAALTITSPGLSLVRDDVGDLYIHGIDGLNGSVIGSRDAITWTRTGPVLWRWWAAGAAGHTPEALCGVFHEGRVLVGHTQSAASGTTYDASVGVISCGGYATDGAPAYSGGSLNDDRAAWFKTYAPFDLPNNVGWTAPGTLPSTSDIVSPGAWRIAEAGAVASFGYTWALLDYGEAWGEWTAVTTSSTGTSVQKPAFMDCYVYNGTAHTYGFKVTMGASFIYLHEQTGAGTYNQVEAAAISPPVNASGDLVPVSVRWVITGSRVKVWWRYATDAPTDTWTLLKAHTGLPDIVAIATSSQLRMGARVGGGDEVLTYGMRYNQSQTARGASIYDATTADLNGRKLGTEGVYVGDGVVVSAAGGPTVPGDVWTIDTAYDYELDRVLQSGPRRGWRSLNTTSDIKLAFRWSSDGDGPTDTDTFGLALCSTNIGRVIVEFYDADTSTWTGATTHDLTLGPLRWTRAGAVITPRSGSYSGFPTPLLREAEWDGASFTELAATRLIRTGSTGKWTGATTVTPRLRVVSPTGLSANGTTGRLIARDAVVLGSFRGASFSGIRITLEATGGASSQYPTAEGYWRLGSLLVGSVALFADETAWGRVLSVTPRREVVSYDDGTEVGRILGAPGRREEFGWSDGIDTTAASEDSDDPSHHLLDPAGSPMALTAATAWTMEGLYTRLAGRERDDVVKLARIEPFAGGAVTAVINRRHNILVGRIESDSLRLETVQGDESVDEVVRVGVLTVSELT